MCDVCLCLYPPPPPPPLYQKSHLLRYQHANTETDKQVNRQTVRQTSRQTCKMACSSFVFVFCCLFFVVVFCFVFILLRICLQNAGKYIRHNCTHAHTRRRKGKKATHRKKREKNPSTTRQHLVNRWGERSETLRLVTVGFFFFFFWRGGELCLLAPR